MSNHNLKIVDVEEFSQACKFLGKPVVWEQITRAARNCARSRKEARKLLSQRATGMKRLRIKKQTLHGVKVGYHLVLDGVVSKPKR
jgi:hypothetical protein